MHSRKSSNEQTFKQLEQTGWNEKAKNYHVLAGGITQQAIQPILKEAGIKKGIKLLDVACGPGYIAGSASKQGVIAIGVDFAPGMVAEAKVNFPSTEYQQGDAEALEFEDNSFDVVTCAFGLLHLAEPDKAIAEAFRVLRPGGCYVFSVWSSPEKHEFFRLVLEAIENHGTFDVSLPEAPPIFRFSETKECQKTLSKAGFTDVDVKELSIFWEPGTADDLIQFLDKSSVRTAMLLEMQTPEALLRIHQAIRNGAYQFMCGERFRLAWPAVMAVAMKPQ